LDRGSNVAVTNAGLTVIRAGVKIVGMTHENTVAGRTHDTATVGVDPADGFKVNWAGQASPNALRGSKLWQLPGE
jgi:hypothetical protein